METDATGPMGMTDEQRDALVEDIKAKNPGREIRLAEARELGEWVIFKTPSRAEFRIYVSKREGEKDGTNAAAEFYLDSCVLYPDKKGLKDQLDRRPALFLRWAGEINESTGARAEITQKKL